MFVVPALLATCLPVAYASSLSSGDAFSDPASSRSAIEMCYFLTGMLLTSVFAIPTLLWHAGTVPKESALLAVAGALAMMIAGGVYQVVFNKKDEEAF